MVRLQTAAENRFSIRDGMLFEDLPWDLSCPDLIATVSDANGLKWPVPLLSEFEEKMGFGRKTGDILQPGVKAPVTDQRWEDGLEFFQRRVSQPVLS